jgi:hypothetical protein
MQTLVANGISGTRLYANVEKVFATQSADWTKIDPLFDKLHQAGMQPTLMISDTPGWLQPSPNPCSTHAFPIYAAPTNNDAYASIAAQYVAHMDQKYPGLVKYYEIWNEPDTAARFCGLTPGDFDSAQSQVRLNEYKALYQAVAIAMKKQAATDGVSILVGGPALANYEVSSSWISQLVQITDNGSKLVDFVSYHQYPSGSDVSHTMTWDGAGGTASLYSRTINPTTGFAATYQSLAKTVGSVPILLDEFDGNWDFFNDCCKNSPTYSPVWNTMVFSLLMNTTYSGAPMMEHLSYYSASNQPFCLLGFTDDGQYGCGTTGTQLPYPQFRAFELLASPKFLGLQANGGNLAQSVTNTAAMNSAGLVSTAFYTPGLDAVVLVNPTGSAISSVALVLGNHGLNNPTATQYLLNASTYSPTAEVQGTALELTTNGASAEAMVTIPPHSVLAIKVTGQ